jgi:hypothetical protein
LALCGTLAKKRRREGISPEWGGTGEELGVDERHDGEEEMSGDKKFDGSWDVVNRISYGGGLARCPVRPCARRRRVGPVWLKREESRHAAHQLRRTATLLQGGDD